VAIDLGLVTIEKVNECLLAQRQQREEGPHHRRIAALMTDLGYLTGEQAKMVLKVQQKKRGYELIPGYRVLSPVGRGAMGTVYKALQVRMEREVAIKILSPKYAQRPEFVERFFREARAAGFTDYYAEVYPNWGLDGPQPWLVAQLLQDPAQDAARADLFALAWRAPSSSSSSLSPRASSAGPSTAPPWSRATTGCSTRPPPASPARTPLPTGCASSCPTSPTWFPTPPR